MFPQNIGRAVLLLYSNVGDLVIDPFAGHNSRMALTVKEGRRYQGYDICAEFMTSNREEALKYPDAEIQLHQQDSRRMIYSASDSGDFTVTSPPYYDIEHYGDEPEQLGKLPSYESFLTDLGAICFENHRVLKKGAYSVWFINDFRKDGVFHAYHMDLTALMLKAGFSLVDTMIVDLGYPIRAAFANQIVEQKILPKRHEYGMVFKK